MIWQIRHGVVVGQEASKWCRDVCIGELHVQDSLRSLKGNMPSLLLQTPTLAGQLVCNSNGKGLGYIHVVLSQTRPAHIPVLIDWTCTFLHHLHSMGSITSPAAIMLL